MELFVALFIAFLCGYLGRGFVAFKCARQWLEKVREIRYETASIDVPMMHDRYRQSRAIKVLDDMEMDLRWENILW